MLFSLSLLSLTLAAPSSKAGIAILNCSHDSRSHQELWSVKDLDNPVREDAIVARPNRGEDVVFDFKVPAALPEMVTFGKQARGGIAVIPAGGLAYTPSGLKMTIAGKTKVAPISKGPGITIMGQSFNRIVGSGPNGVIDGSGPTREVATHAACIYIGKVPGLQFE